MTERIYKTHRYKAKLFEKITLISFIHEKDLIYKNIVYPNPPDCVLTLCNNKKIWLEETSHYRHWDKQIDPNQWEFRCPQNDEPFAVGIQKNIIQQIIAKDSKKNYQGFEQKYGPGILLVRIDDLCIETKETFIKITDQEKYKHLKLKTFRSVYLFDIDHIGIEKCTSIRYNAFYLLYGKDINEIIRE